MIPSHTLRVCAVVLVALCQAAAQPPNLDRVLAFPPPISGEHLHPDLGAAGAWHRLAKLTTTASVLHITAHPDDEHSGMLTLVSRGRGVRTALLSINRGEGGANAIGPELFDALGLLRTRELVLSGRHYGLDDLYFTSAADYGYSKTVEESFRSWDREAVLGDMVRVIRLNRPLVVVSRFHGSRRDGHGNHHAAGVLTPEAVAAAADPERFPEQLASEGLRPWRVARVYRGGVRPGEPHDVAMDANRYSPSLGMSWQRWANLGLSLQRSQTAGRVRRGTGQVYRYERVDAETGGGSGAATGAAEAPRPDMTAGPDVTGGSAVANRAADSFFAGLDTRLTGLPALLGEAVTAPVAERLAGIQAAIEGVIRDFDFTAPNASVAGLVRGLALLRALAGGAEISPEMAFHLAIKERQFADAIMAAGGVEVAARLEREAGGGVVVPGEVVGVGMRVESAIAGSVEMRAVRFALGGRGTLAAADHDDVRLESAAYAGVFRVRIPDDAPTARPYFSRAGIHENHYQVADSAALHLPWSPSGLHAVAELAVAGAQVSRTVPVTVAVPRLPHGQVERRVEVVAAVGVAMAPAVLVVPEGGGRRGGVAEPARAASDSTRAIELLVRMEAHAPDLSVSAELEVPAGWAVWPPAVRHDFARRGEVAEASFSLQPPPAWHGEISVQATARATLRGIVRDFGDGYQTIDHQDLPLARLRIPARTVVRSVATRALDGLAIGYVMGAGDEVPAAIQALGATVRLLDESDLAGAELGDFAAIVVGTRAYAVRRDLAEHNQRLLDYARGGGNVVVLYQTQEFVPDEMAPWPASLPPGAEEVSEEDAPVEFLLPDHPLLTVPNRISGADFNGWLEQRGSKFFADWNPAWTPLVETHDTGQPPQRGIWLTAETGAGRYSYLALALHRQLPHGVPGAYRILANALWPRP